jgi:FMN phosphatase YigB (HAD superfamily)
VVFDYGFTLSSATYFNVVPPECPRWHELIQEHIFAHPTLVDEWMAGEHTLVELASILAPHVGMDVPTIVHTMEEGCRSLASNQAVLDFALAQRPSGRKTALVTGNMDVFDAVVVPAHGLDRIFDVILNSYDYRELDKRVLWPIAFEQLGPGIGYHNSLLIEDSLSSVRRFRAAGGTSYRYQGDEGFLEWLRLTGWDQQ